MTNINPAIYAMGAIFAGPSADGTNGQVLVTNGSKQLSFTTIASGGVSSLNSLTGALSIAVGASGSDVAVSTSGSTVTVSVPDAGASARGVITTGTQTIAGSKTLTGNTVLNATSGNPLIIQSGGVTKYTFDPTWFNIGGVLNTSGYEIAVIGNVTYLVNRDAAGQFRIYSNNSESLRIDASVHYWYYNSTNYVSTTVASNGGVTFDSVSGTTTPGFTFSDPVTVTGKLSASEGISAGPITFAVLNATTATATLGVYRITDRANRLAYPDGTNWRFVADDAIIS